MDTELDLNFRKICIKSMQLCQYPSRNLHNPTSMAALPALPNELLLMLGDCLSPRELNALLRTSKHMHALYNDYLYKLTVREKKNFTLFWAAIKGQPTVAQRVLDLGAQAETATEHCSLLTSYGTVYETPLLTAIAHNRLEVVQVLLHHGVDINIQGSRRLIPLEMATKEGREDIVRVLLERGADVNQTSERHQTPLHSAVTGRHVPSLVELLLTKGAHVNALDGDMNTPLHVAYDKETVKILVKSGARINDANMWDVTPLSIAVRAKDKEWVRLLLQSGAEVNAPNRKGETALFWVGRKLDNIRQPPIKMSNDPYVEIAKTLLDFGANIHCTDTNGSTALFSIVELGDVPTVKLLLERGSYAAIRNRKGLTPLHVAAEEGWPLILQLLLKHNANINAVNYYRSTSLHRLTSISKKRIRPSSNVERYSDALAVLISAGANLNLQDRIGQTPLMKAAYHGYWKFVDQLLVAPGIDVVIKDRRNKTASDLIKDSGYESKQLLIVTAEEVEKQKKIEADEQNHRAESYDLIEVYCDHQD